MGILVHDTVEIPSIGVQISNFTVTIKGTFQFSKDGNVYHIRAIAHWYTQNAVRPINEEAIYLSVTDIPDNVFTAIYDRIKMRYQDWEDV